MSIDVLAPPDHPEVRPRYSPVALGCVAVLTLGAAVVHLAAVPRQLAEYPLFGVFSFPNTPLTGYVREVQRGAAGEFSLFPETNTAGNFQKVTQVIPIKIALEDRRGLDLVPGMNVTVHIHKR